MNNSSTAVTDGLAPRPLLLAAAAISMGTAMAVIDGSVTNVALPIIAHDLNAPPTQAIWVLNAYQITVLCTLLPFSALGDSHGHKRVYLGGLLLFVLASLACTLAASIPVLALSRAVQGVGAAALMSVSMALVRASYPQKMLGRGIGVSSMVVAISAATGPTLAGAVLSVLSWPWIFAINLPFGIAALVLGWRFLPQTIPTGARFDWLSALQNIVTVGLMMAVVEGFSHGAPAWLLGGLAALLGMVGYAFVRRQIGQTHPLLPIDLLRRPIIGLSVLASISSFIAQMSVLVSLPFFLHDRLGFSGAEVGLLITPWALTLAVMAPIAGWLADRYNAGLLGAIGLGIAALGMAMLSLLTQQAAPADIVWRVMLCGVGLGLFMSPNARTIVNDTPRHRTGAAGGLLSSARLSGQTLGAMLAGLMLNVWPTSGEQTAMAVAAGVALLAGLLSLARLRTVPRQ